MIAAALTAAVALAFDCAFAAAAHRAAATYRLSVYFFRRAAPLMLLLLAALQVAAALRCGDARGVRLLIAAGAAGICALTDAQTGYVFDAITLPALALILAAAIADAFIPTLAGAAVTGGSLFFLYAVTRGRGIGLGDVKLACCIGAALGMASGMRALQLAFVLGALYAVARMMLRLSQFGEAVPFAPFLYAGMMIAALGDGA